MVRIIDEVADEWADLIIETIEENYGLTVKDKKRVREAFLARVQGILANPDPMAQEQGLDELQAEGYTLEDAAAALVKGGAK